MSLVSYASNPFLPISLSPCICRGSELSKEFWALLLLYVFNPIPPGQWTHHHSSSEAEKDFEDAFNYSLSLPHFFVIRTFPPVGGIRGNALNGLNKLLHFASVNATHSFRISTLDFERFSLSITLSFGSFHFVVAHILTKRSVKVVRKKIRLIVLMCQHP